jgi:hypothetical protein
MTNSVDNSRCRPYKESDNYEELNNCRAFTPERKFTSGCRSSPSGCGRAPSRHRRQRRWPCSRCQRRRCRAGGPGRSGRRPWRRGRRRSDRKESATGSTRNGRVSYTQFMPHSEPRCPRRALQHGPAAAAAAVRPRPAQLQAHDVLHSVMCKGPRIATPPRKRRESRAPGPCALCTAAVTLPCRARANAPCIVHGRTPGTFC